jgi:hypothetical protein
LVKINGAAFTFAVDMGTLRVTLAGGVEIVFGMETVAFSSTGGALLVTAVGNEEGSGNVFAMGTSLGGALRLTVGAGTLDTGMEAAAAGASAFTMEEVATALPDEETGMVADTTGLSG